MTMKNGLLGKGKCDYPVPRAWPANLLGELMALSRESKFGTALEQRRNNGFFYFLGGESLNLAVL